LSNTHNRTQPFPAATEPALAEGLIVSGSRGLYDVQTPDGLLRCTIRGRLRKQLEYPESNGKHRSVRNARVKEHDPVAVGDRVRALPTGDGTGVIAEVIARAGGSFTRGDPDRGQGRLTTIAGLDQMILVFAAREPTPHLRLLDRFLVLAETQRAPATIVINKVDLGVESWLAERLALYRTLGYPVIQASAATGEGVAELRQCLAGRVSALLGPSGVGKSSLLNALQPELAQRVSAVGTTTHKGRHTTTGTRLCPLEGPEGGYIADTAGIRALALAGSATAALDRAFVEFRPLLGDCHHRDCAHLTEPGCAIREAVRVGAVDRARYESYCRLRLDGGDPAEWDDVE
jgi:ribosome biogenesis GTPase